MKLTLAYCLALAVVTIAFDAWQYARGGWTATISYLILSRATRYPIIAFACGVLAGHLFWPQPTPDETPPDARR